MCTMIWSLPDKPSTNASHPTTTNKLVTNKAIIRAGKVRPTKSMTSSQVIPPNNRTP